MANTYFTQQRAVDPFASYNSNVVNRLTRMATDVYDCILRPPDLEVSIDTTSQITIQSGICFKDDVLIEITADKIVDVTDIDYYTGSGNWGDSTGIYYICLHYEYVKGKPPPTSSVIILAPHQRSAIDSGRYLFLKAMVVDQSVFGEYYISSLLDADPNHATTRRRRYSWLYEAMVDADTALQETITDLVDGEIVDIQCQLNIFLDYGYPANNITNTEITTSIPNIADVMYFSYNDYTSGVGPLNLAYSTVPTIWTTTTVDPTSEARNGNDLAIDTTGVIHICYGDGDGIHYVTNKTGSYVDTIIDASSINCIPRIALNSNNKVYISYKYRSGGVATIYCMTNVSGSWIRLTVEALTQNYTLLPLVDITINTCNEPNLSYINDNNAYIRYAIYSGAVWTCTDVSSTSITLDTRTAIQTNSIDKVHIIYTLSPYPQTLHHITNASGAWVDTDTGYPGPSNHVSGMLDMDLDSAGKVHVVTLSMGWSNVYYSTNATGAWVHTKLADSPYAINSALQKPVRIFVDEADTIHIVFTMEYTSYVSNRGKIYYIYKTGASWSSIIDTGTFTYLPTTVINDIGLSKDTSITEVPLPRSGLLKANPTSNIEISRLGGEDGDELTIWNALPLDSTSTDADDLTISTEITFPAGSYNYRDITITGAGKLICQSSTSGTYGSGVTITARNITIEAGGWICADGEGFMGGLVRDGFGPGYGGGAGISGQYGGAGASYGGLGGNGGNYSSGINNYSRPVYSYVSSTQPIAVGSGGGCGDDANGPDWGNGGGAIKLIVSGTLTCDGYITADGVPGHVTTHDAPGGGSGGSIWIWTNVFAGGVSGYVHANGGYGGNSLATAAGGGGGGGVIRITYADNSGWNGSVSVTKGLGGAGFAYNGADGSDGVSSTAVTVPPEGIDSTNIPVVTIIHNPQYISLLEGTDVVLPGQCSIRLRKVDGVWHEIGRNMCFGQKLNNGFVALNNGTYIQWGCESSTYNLDPGGKTIDFVFPITFPNSCLAVHSTIYCDTGYSANTYVKSKDINGTSIFAEELAVATQDMKVGYLAIGY